MNKMAKKIIIYSMVGLFQLGLGASAIEAAPAPEAYPWQQQQPDNDKRQQEPRKDEQQQPDKNKRQQESRNDQQQQPDNNKHQQNNDRQHQ